MKVLIQAKLRELEQQEQIRILLAVESGSRAWGFASPDSDYDVRFIYVRKQEDYLRLNPVRDVIELPISDELDINGWDLQKALKLLYASNPTLFEWFSSPIVYQETEFAQEFREIMADYFVTKKSVYHYISMAQSNYRAYLLGDMVRAKKYFYVLRPLLACRWVLDRGTPSPMRFTELMEAELPHELSSTVEYLLDIKMNSPEIKEIPKVQMLNDYLESGMEEIKDLASGMEDHHRQNWERLNQLFLETIKAQ